MSTKSKFCPWSPVSTIRSSDLRDLYVCPTCGAMFAVEGRYGKGKPISLRPFDGLVGGVQVFDEDLKTYVVEYNTGCLCSVQPVKVPNKEQLTGALLDVEIKSMRLMD